MAEGTGGLERRVRDCYWILYKLQLFTLCRLTIDLSNKLNSSLFQAVLLKNLAMEIVNALLEKRLQMLSNVSKESTS